MFNDKIFIRDSWWFPLKVYDFVLGEKQNVKVDLLKIGAIGISLEDTQPTRLYEHPLLCYSFDDPCIACCCQNLVLTTIWTLTPDFQGATMYFSDPSGSVIAQQGWYNDGNATLFINEDGIAISQWDCTTCDCEQTGLTEQATCYAPTQCEACCCSTGDAQNIYTDGTTLGNSRRAWGNASGTIPLLPFTWYAKSGEVFLIGADGITVLVVGLCEGCDCEPLEQLAPLPGFYFPDSPVDSCCLEGVTGYIGTSTYWSEQSTFFPATGFYTQNSVDFPLGTGATAPIYLSDGEYYKQIEIGLTTITTPCPPSLSCSNRTNSVKYNLLNASGADVNIDAQYDISFDGVNYYYAGATAAGGTAFTNQTDIFYNPNSFMRAELDVTFGIPLTPGILDILLLVNGATAFTDNIPTPGTYITPPLLAGTGTNEWFFTWTP
jgi:hypothetical protein